MWGREITMQTVLCKYRMWKVCVAVWSLSLVLVALGRAEETIAEGKRVSLEYTLTLGDQTVYTNVGKDPLIYTHGSKEIVPGLEKQLTGLQLGDTKKIEVSPEEGFGTLDPNRVQEVPKEIIPEEAREVGKTLRGRGPDGQIKFAQVIEIKDKTVTVGLNHPLAGQKLFFDVKVLKVETEERHKVQLPDDAAGTQSKE